MLLVTKSRPLDRRHLRHRIPLAHLRRSACQPLNLSGILRSPRLLPTPRVVLQGRSTLHVLERFPRAARQALQLLVLIERTRRPPKGCGQRNCRMVPLRLRQPELQEADGQSVSQRPLARVELPLRPGPLSQVPRSVAPQVAVVAGVARVVPPRPCVRLGLPPCPLQLPKKRGLCREPRWPL